MRRCGARRRAARPCPPNFQELQAPRRENYTAARCATEQLLHHAALLSLREQCSWLLACLQACLESVHSGVEHGLLAYLRESVSPAASLRLTPLGTRETHVLERAASSQSGLIGQRGRAGSRSDPNSAVEAGQRWASSLFLMPTPRPVPAGEQNKKMQHRRWHAAPAARGGAAHAASQPLILQPAAEGPTGRGGAALPRKRGAGASEWVSVASNGARL